MEAFQLLLLAKMFEFHLELTMNMKRSACRATGQRDFFPPEAHAEIAILNAIDYRLHRSGTLGSDFIDSRRFRNTWKHHETLLAWGRSFLQPRRSKERITVQLQCYIYGKGKDMSVNLYHENCSLTSGVDSMSTYTFQSAMVPSTA